VDFLELPPAARVLDLCTGTADLLLEALGRDRGHRGVGIDLSHEMLLRGAQKLGRDGFRGSGLVQGDAERLPLRSACWDAALVAFGIRNVGDPEAALVEIVRVLRPGARLVVLEFSMPGGLLGSLYRVYFRQVLPRVGGLVSGDRAAYLPARLRVRFPTPDTFRGPMLRAGWHVRQSH
jgi:demethylmenaquinone methyltransferase/2-methoxy-6-polyprenyl-1,4-benzoquinol methylase